MKKLIGLIILFLSFVIWSGFSLVHAQEEESPTPIPTPTPITYACSNHDQFEGNPTGIPQGYHVNSDGFCVPDCNPDNADSCVSVTPTPTPVQPPPPSNPGGPGDGRSDGRSDGLSSCPSCTAPPKGQVLGATTSVLASTGSFNNQIISGFLGITAAVGAYLFGRVLLRAHENS